MTALDREPASIQQSEPGFQEGQINGMTATMADGTGMMDGARVDLGIALILLPEGKVMIILGIANPSAPASTAREFSEIMASIRPEA